jgi:hypothetical protein
MSEDPDNAEKDLAEEISSADNKSIPPKDFHNTEDKHGPQNSRADYDKSNNQNISHIINRRNRILNHIRREQFLLCFPNTMPFLNERHAFESLLPYHFFANGTLEDFLFANTRFGDRSFDVQSIMSYVDTSIRDVQKSFSKNYNMVLDLMDLEAHKFILSKYSARVDEMAQDRAVKRNPFLFTEKRRTEKRNTAIKLRPSKEMFESHKYVRAVNEKLFFRREK